MLFDSKSVNKAAAMLIILVLVVIAFYLIRPIFLAIIAGLILAYIVNPFYKKVNKKLKRPTLSAFIVSALLLAVIIIPLWFLIPVVIRQVFDMFTALQRIDIGGFISIIFPAANPQFVTEITSVSSNFLSTMSVNVLNWLVDFLIDLPNLLLQGAVLIFVFFFALRDQEALRAYVSELSPLNRKQEQIFVKEFKGITNSIVYGYIIIGIIQGIATGIGLFVFGVPRPLLFTILAIFASIFPLIGPWVIFIPASIYLFTTGHTAAAIAFLVYGFLIVSSLDNILRPYIVSKRTNISPVIALIGMIGGLFVFGLMGLIIGPLILAYLIIFLTAYKNKELSKMFTKESE